MRVLVVGGGRLARALADDLRDGEHEVRVLEPAGANAGRLTESAAASAGGARPGPLLLHGSPLHRPTLANAADGCDALAAVSDTDALNAVVALAARRELRVPVALAAIAAPGLADALHGLGIRVVCPTTRTARELRGALARSDVESELLLGREAAMFRVQVPPHLAGRRLAELEHPGGLVVAAVERAGRTTIAVPDLALEPGDVLHVAARDRDLVHGLVGT